MSFDKAGWRLGYPRKTYPREKVVVGNIHLSNSRDVFIIKFDDSNIVGNVSVEDLHEIEKKMEYSAPIFKRYVKPKKNKKPNKKIGELSHGTKKRIEKYKLEETKMNIRKIERKHVWNQKFRSIDSYWIFSDTLEKVGIDELKRREL